MMDVELIIQLNQLWRPIYPYLAKWIRRRWCPAHNGRVLELGPFSGGIGSSLLDQNPQLETIGLFQQEDLVKPIRDAFHLKIKIILGTLDSQPFLSSFDLVIYRGAFFYLTPAIIQESMRTIRPGGYALLGGGYGPLTPQDEIEKIAGESKDLNDRLGKRLMRKEALFRMVRDAGLAFCSTIIEEGGLWLLVSREV